MKKTIILLVSALLGVGTVTSQTSERALSQGDNAINVYYGINLLTSFYKGLATETATDVKVTGVGPVGIVYEHMVTDGIGLGAEFSYASTTLSYIDKGLDNNGQIKNYDWEVKFATVRAFFRANFHFTKSEKFDSYFLLAAGYRNSTFTVKTNDPYNQDNFKFTGFIPFGLKPGIGFRYFFTPNVGINLEIAAGTPVMGGGLSFKF